MCTGYPTVVPVCIYVGFASLPNSMALPGSFSINETKQQLLIKKSQYHASTNRREKSNSEEATQKRKRQLVLPSSKYT
jgi:hypothetical protein